MCMHALREMGNDQFKGSRKKYIFLVALPRGGGGVNALPFLKLEKSEIFFVATKLEGEGVRP